MLETALAIPALLAVTVALAWGLSLVGTAAALGDAARQVARDVARGVAPQAAVEAARASMPEAEITIEEAEGMSVVVARRAVSAPVPLLAGLSVPMSQRVAFTQEWP